MNDTLQEQIEKLREELAVQRLEQKRLSLCIDCATDHAIIQLDPENYIASWNLGAERILGYKADEVVGKSGEIFFSPEDVASGRIAKEMGTAREQGRADDERWHMRKDGTRFWGSGVMTPLFDDNRQLLGFCKIMRDLTDRKLAADRLRQSEEHFRMLVENVTNCALFQVDLQGNISSWNPGAEGIFQYGTTEAIGLSFARLVAGGQKELTAPELNSPSNSEERVEGEGWLVRKDGSRLFARWVATPMRGVAGNLQGMVYVLRDETHRKMNEELAQRRQELEREYLQSQVETTSKALDNTKEELRALAASLLTVQEEESHRIARELHDDLAQRLAMIQVNTSRLRQTIPLELAGAKEELLRIERQTAAISDDVRGLSHQLHPTILDDLGLPAALEALAEEFQSGAPKEVIFEAEQVPDSIPASISVTLYRIAQEALRNVSKHASNSQVRILLRGAPDQLALTISDTGPGFSLDARTAGGLGIINMKERAQLIGATLSIVTALGEGTSVQVTAFLPRND
jgi:PAS domain S-box-containing protein